VADGDEGGGGRDDDDLVGDLPQLAGDGFAPVGAATTIRSGPAARRAPIAARIVDPVASPSSTTITVRPLMSGRGRAPR
jgi:hypothetical protein